MKTQITALYQFTQTERLSLEPEYQINSEGEETITLPVSVLNRMLSEARRAGTAYRARGRGNKGLPEPFTPFEIDLIATLLKQGHTPLSVFRGMETGLHHEGNIKKLDLSGYFIRTTLFYRPYLRRNKTDVFSIEELADIKTLLELGLFTVKDIAERYKKPNSEVRVEGYFKTKLHRSGYIIGYILESKP